MGYTHYWRSQRAFTDQEWSKVCDLVKQAFRDAELKGLKLAGGDGTGVPTVTSEVISFNGAEPQGYETCLLQKAPNNSFEFCKTQHRPYDAAVVTLLFRLNQSFPDDLSVSSDGGDGAIRDEFI